MKSELGYTAKGLFCDTDHPHNSRADKDSYQQDRHIQCLMLDIEDLFTVENNNIQHL